MSRQEVNLLAAGLLPPPDRLPISAVGKLAAGTAALAIAASLYGHWQMSTTEAAVALHQAQSVSNRAEVARLTALNNRQGEKVALNRQLEQLVGQQQLKRVTLDMLEREAGGVPRASISNLFVGVAEAHVPGLWITQVAFDLKIDALQISGAADQPDRIPSFLTQLRATTAFATSSVGGLEVRATDSGPVSFDFRGELRGAAG